ncbi:MAG: cadherin-like domain-containing protein, partial [Rhodobacteraceae bacterium]|nr:cadherin-like domain-containing protein [Paracoccaceae bacterium]
DPTAKTLSFDVTAVNHAPVAVDDSATVDAGDSVLIDVLANDSDAEHQLLTLAVVSQPLHGTAVIERGQVRYTPSAGNFAADSFRYVVADSAGATATGNVHVAVGAGPNHAPTLDTMADASVKEGEILTVLAKAHDVDGGDTLRYALDAPFAAGARIDPISGVISWRATDGDNHYGFSVRVNDSAGASATRSFTVNVVNVAPTLTAGGLPVAYAGERFTLNLSSADPGDDSIRYWRIDWGDGQLIDYAGNPRQLVHRYNGVLGPLQIRAMAADEDGSYLVEPLQVVVLPRPLQLGSFARDASSIAGSAGVGQDRNTVSPSPGTAARTAATPQDVPAGPLPAVASEPIGLRADVSFGSLPQIDFQPRPAGFRLPVRHLRGEPGERGARGARDDWRQSFVTDLARKSTNPNNDLRVMPGPSLQSPVTPEQLPEDVPEGTQDGMTNRRAQHGQGGVLAGGVQAAQEGTQERTREGAEDGKSDVMPDQLLLVLPLAPCEAVFFRSILGRTTWQTKKSKPRHRLPATRHSASG